MNNSQYPNPNPPNPLHTSLSSLKSHIHSSKSTLNSLPTYFPHFQFPPSNPLLLQCPSNPTHHVSPSSLFHHFLHCPTTLHVSPLTYPTTLTSTPVDNFSQRSSDLCLSIDEFFGFEPSFFYYNCPAVVSIRPGNDVDAGNGKRVFTLPGVLSIECGTMNEGLTTLPGGGNDVDGGNSKRVLSVEWGSTNGVFSTLSGVVMLPSEMWVVSNEVGLWSDFPDEYSYSVLRGLLCLNFVDESVLLTWLIANSPRFGVVIDVPMRDHMSVLFRVCFKAVVREASRSYRGLFESDEGGGGCRKFDSKSLRFKCPVLVEVMRWLVSQLSILYGEMNARGFVIASLGHVLRSAVSCALLFPLDKKLEKTEVSREIVKNIEDDRTDVRLFSRLIFVYQIAAAVAALHERSLLEERIRALRNPPPLTAYQRMVEHEHFSKKADEERQKRPDYRPLIEHDSIFSQQQNDQETNRLKTREELLAEERDYKRQRMSYRGKKHKRSSKEVMRDIIEEYMEAIKQTGGIGGLATEDAGATSTWKNTSTQNQKSMNLETNHGLKNDQQDSYRTSLDSGHKTRDKRSDPSPFRKEQQHKSESDYYRNHDQTMNGDRYSRDHRSRSPSRDRRHSRSPSRDRRHSRSPSRDRRHSQSKEHRNHRRNEHVTEMVDNEGSRRNYSTSSAQRRSSGRRDKRKLESSDRGRWNKHGNDERGSHERIEFSDRYNPSEDDHFIDN